MRKLALLVAMVCLGGAVAISTVAHARIELRPAYADPRGPGPWREDGISSAPLRFVDDDSSVDDDDDDDDDRPRYAQLASSAAGLFLKLVNEQLNGRIDPRSVAYVAPAGLVLEDVVLTAPGNRPVARIGYAKVELNIGALFSGEI
ncbi:MAG TPA: hypothetical protein VGF99_08870, partial [Myxococcota bacterium]